MSSRTTIVSTQLSSAESEPLRRAKQTPARTTGDRVIKPAAQERRYVEPLPVVRSSWSDELSHFGYEFWSFLRAEIVQAVIDTLRLMQYAAGLLGWNVRRVAAPVAHRVADAADGNNLARDVVSFLEDGARVVVRR